MRHREVSCTDPLVPTRTAHSRDLLLLLMLELVVKTSEVRVRIESVLLHYGEAVWEVERVVLWHLHPRHVVILVSLLLLLRRGGRCN